MLHLLLALRMDQMADASYSQQSHRNQACAEKS
jgi:hypothetical protein